MSQEEQDRIVGRLTRETREAEREEAACLSEMKGFSAGLAQASKEINGCIGEPFVTKPEILAKTLNDLPSGQTILEALRRLLAAKERARDLRSQLEALTK